MKTFIKTTFDRSVEYAAVRRDTMIKTAGEREKIDKTDGEKSRIKMKNHLFEDLLLHIVIR